jgi:hypothetical protein
MAVRKGVNLLYGGEQVRDEGGITVLPVTKALRELPSLLAHQSISATD